MKKQELRKEYLAKRMNLSPQEYADFNDALLKQFQMLNLSNVKCISLFLPMLERREPNTFNFVDWLKDANPEITIAFPKADFMDNTMLHYIEDNELEIDTNAYGIPEPIAGNIIPNTEIDMVIIPLLAFDLKGYRVGYGKGFYDRLLINCKPAAQFIGLSFFEPVDTIDDANEYDIIMHKCITPEKLWAFDA